MPKIIEIRFAHMLQSQNHDTSGAHHIRLIDVWMTLFTLFVIHILE